MTRPDHFLPICTYTISIPLLLCDSTCTLQPSPDDHAVAYQQPAGGQIKAFWQDQNDDEEDLRLEDSM